MPDTGTDYQFSIYQAWAQLRLRMPQEVQDEWTRIESLGRGKRAAQSSLINALVPKSTTFSTKQPLQVIPNGWQRYREQRDTRYRDERRKGVSYTAMLALVHTEERLREGVLACLKV